MLSWIKMMRQNEAKRRMAELEERIRVLQNQNEWQKRTQASLFGQYEDAKKLLESYSERCATLYAENTMHRIRPAYNGSQALVDFFFGRETFRKGEPEPAQDDTAMSVLRSLGWRAAQYEDVTKRDVLDRLEPVVDPQKGKSLDELHTEYCNGMQQRVENKAYPEEDGTLVAMLRNMGWRAADREIAIRKRTEEVLQPNEVKNSRRRVDPPHYPS